MKLYEHKDYEEYKKAQIWKNVGKLSLVWIKPKEIKALVEHIKEHIPSTKFGICHGVRNAWEVEQLRELLGIEVIGTDISHTATEFPNTIEWDFHDVKDEWLSNVDFIYSNSYDHSNNPSMCLDKWMSCIKKDGVCYIHWNHENAKPAAFDAADCFSATETEYRKLFNKKYKIVDEIISISGRTIFAIKHR